MPPPPAPAPAQWTRLKRSSDVGIEIGNPLVNRALLGMDPWVEEKVMLHNLPQFLATLPPARFAVGFGDGWNGRAMHASALGRVSSESPRRCLLLPRCCAPAAPPHPPPPRRAVPQRALRDLFFRGGYYITSTDEFRTSMLCSRCFMVLRKVVLVVPRGAAAGTRRPSWAVVR